MFRQLVIILFLTPILAHAQIQLGPMLNSGLLPAPTDPIQPVANYIDSTSLFIAGGYQVGDAVNDFILYDTANAPYQLSQLLTTGKPVLLTSGSYSCPAYRACMDQVIPDLVAIYGQQVIFVNVYQLEAHPSAPDISPFYGAVNVPGQNVLDSIYIPQHLTYADRRNAATASLVAMGAPCKVLLDGPGNEYWTRFGPSPNNAYLITPEGKVFTKYGWLHQSKQQAIMDINHLLLTIDVPAMYSPDLLGFFANPGNENSTITLATDKPCLLQIYTLSGVSVGVSQLMPGQPFAIGEALPEEGVYLLAIIADDRHELVRYVKVR